MTKEYNEEFKKQLVNEYLNGTSYPSLEKAYGVAKSTISEWVKKYSEECQYTQPLLSADSSQSAKEIHELNKKSSIRKGKSFPKKSSGILRKGNRLLVYRFIDNYKKLFGVRWLLRKFSLSPIPSITILKTQSLSIKNNGSGFRRK